MIKSMVKLCSEGCERVAFRRGLCRKRYNAVRSEGKTCKFCDRRWFAKDMCVSHYNRERDTGELGGEIRSSSGYEQGVIFLENVLLAKPFGCAKWPYSSSGSGPYGRIYVPDKKGMDYAHRISYEMAWGEIPFGLEIDHLCCVKLCVNPAHLEAVTHEENVFRRDEVRR